MNVQNELFEFIWKTITPSYLKDHSAIHDVLKRAYDFAYDVKVDEFKEWMYSYRVMEANLYRNTVFDTVPTYNGTKLAADILTYNIGNTTSKRPTEPYDYLLSNMLEGRIKVIEDYKQLADNKVRFDTDLFSFYVDLKTEQFVMEFFRQQNGGYNDGWFIVPDGALITIVNDVKAKAEQYFKMKQKASEKYEIMADAFSEQKMKAAEFNKYLHHRFYGD